MDRQGGWGDENIDIPRMVELEVFITLFHDPGVFRGYINVFAVEIQKHKRINATETASTPRDLARAASRWLILRSGQGGFSGWC